MLIQKQPIGTIAYLGGTPAILERFMWSWTNLILYSNEYLTTPATYIHYDHSRVSYHAKARNELVQTMKGNWILMLDSDHVPDPDIAARMLHIFKKYDLQVLTGIYQVKKYPYPPLLYMWNEAETDYELISSFDNPNKVDIFPVAAAGAGCLMIKREVIFRILTELEDRPFDPMKQRNGKLPLSEDLSFFRRCADLDIKCYVAPNIESPHLIIEPITMEANVKAEKSGMETDTKIVEGEVKLATEHKSTKASNTNAAL